jgi:hypothetical protein
MNDLAQRAQARRTHVRAGAGAARDGATSKGRRELIGSRPCRDPRARSATAPGLPAMPRATVHGAKAKRTHVRAGA